MVQEWKIPFRQAKGAVEKAVKYAESEGAETVTPSALKKALQEEKVAVKPTEAFVQKAQESRVFLSRRIAAGGPSPQTFDAHVSSLRQSLGSFRRWLSRRIKQQSLAKIRLNGMELGI
jgi:argininosuccinate lyase